MRHIAILFAGLLASSSVLAQTVIHHRYVNFTLDASSITPVESGGQVYAEFASGESENFLPVRPNNLDRLIVHIKFVNSTVGTNGSGYKKQYLVLRDLGRGLFHQQGWQSFRSTLSLDSGGITATYNPGWTFTVANPTRYALTASPTRTVSGSSSAEASIVFNATDNTLAIHEMTVEYNFNHHSAPFEISDGAGFNRLRLAIQADDIKIAEMPYASLAYGPRSATGATFDFDMDGVPDRGTLSASVRETQHYKAQIYAERGSIISPAEFAYFDVLGPGFSLDPIGEELDTQCSDGVCDGISTISGCSALIGSPEGRGRGKAADTVRSFLLEMGDAVMSTCGWFVYAKIEPRDAAERCEVVSAPSGESVINSVPLHMGTKVLDRVSGALLEGVPAVALRPVGCR